MFKINLTPSQQALAEHLVRNPSTCGTKDATVTALQMGKVEGIDSRFMDPYLAECIYDGLLHKVLVLRLSELHIPEE